MPADQSDQFWVLVCLTAATGGTIFGLFIAQSLVSNIFGCRLGIGN